MVVSHCAFFVDNGGKNNNYCCICNNLVFSICKRGQLSGNICFIDNFFRSFLNGEKGDLYVGVVDWVDCEEYWSEIKSQRLELLGDLFEMSYYGRSLDAGVRCRDQFMCRQKVL